MATKTKRRVSGFDPDEAPVSTGRDSQPRPEEIVEMLQMPKGKEGAQAYKRFRPVGNVFVAGQHWVTTKKRDGSVTSFPTPCLNFDPNTGNRDHDGNCPWCSAADKVPKRKGKDGKEAALIRFGVDYYIQGIDRSEQENAPSRMPRLTAEEKESGFKDINSDSWTPYRVQRLSGQDLKKFRNLKDLNIVKIKGERVAKSVFDVKFGCDVLMKYDKTEAVPGNRWTFSKDERTPLTEEEAEYLTWDLSLLIPDDLDADHAQKEVLSWAKRMGVDKYITGKAGRDEDEEDDDDGEEDEPKRRRTKAEVTKDLKKKTLADLDDDEDEDEDEDDEPPVKKGKKAAPAKKGRVVDEEGDDDDEDDEEDEPPRKKAPAKNRKVVDEDDDEDEDEDEDDEPPKKGKRPQPSRGKKVVDDDEDEDEDDEPPVKKKGRKVVEDDDEDEDEPPVKKGKAPAKKSRKVVEEDDEDDDSDEDEDEDEPPAKKGRRSPPPPPKGKKGRKVVDDDDDDDDDEIPF